MDEYENQAFVAKASNITLTDMLDMWIEEELAPSKRSNGTERSYLNTANRIKQHSIGKRKLKTITAEHLQKFFDSLSSAQPLSNGKESKSKRYRSYFAKCMDSGVKCRKQSHLALLQSVTS